MARRTKSSQLYWRERRALQRMQRAHKSSEQTIGRIIYAHDQALNTLSKEIDELFGRFSEGMTKAEAETLLNTFVTNEEYEKLQELYRTAQTKDVKNEALKRLKAEPLKYRIARKEALQKAIDRNLLRVIDQEVTMIESHLKNTLTSTHLRAHFDAQHLEGIGFPVNTISDSRLKQLTETPWLDRSFSDRVWTNTEDLAVRMNQVIPQGMMAGKSSRQIARDLQDLSDGSSVASERLVRTETTWVVAEADKQVAKERGVKRMRFLATLDSRTSKRCGEMDGSYIEIDKLIAGKNQPPLHPYCRSVLIEDHEGFQHRTRLARDPETGRTYKVPGDMTYAEWRKKYVDNQGKDWAIKAEQNRSNDRKQFARYQTVLGDEVPSSLKEFQKIKYNDASKWDLIGDHYHVKSRLKDGRYGTLINPEKQRDHLASSVKPGKSYLYDSVDPQELFNQFAGTGYLDKDKNGRTNKEIITDCGYPVGYDARANLEANGIKIHHSKGRTHIVPFLEKEN